MPPFYRVWCPPKSAIRHCHVIETMPRHRFAGIPLHAARTVESRTRKPGYLACTEKAVTPTALLRHRNSTLVRRSAAPLQPPAQGHETRSGATWTARNGLKAYQDPLASRSVDSIDSRNVIHPPTWLRFPPELPLKSHDVMRTSTFQH